MRQTRWQRKTYQLNVGFCGFDSGLCVVFGSLKISYLSPILYLLQETPLERAMKSLGKSCNLKETDLYYRERFLNHKNIYFKERFLLQWHIFISDYILFLCQFFLFKNTYPISWCILFQIFKYFQETFLFQRYFLFERDFYFRIQRDFLFQLTFVMFYRFTNFKSSDPFLFLFAFHHFELISVHFLNQEITKYIRKIVMKNYWFLVCLHCWVSTQYCQAAADCFADKDKKLSRLLQYQLFQKIRLPGCAFLFLNVALNFLTFLWI